ncbi:hypothetical protein PHMEG_00022338 [Phytophthora megakarya]|uniref:ABC transporter domain-containing protein n=1 Tax=Phytophthora megakarya TaxID=4795 RepID=A0A225VKD2_9STRA|nr:hypothetical protein PHMEG_00022338 [Phytophthora megakarya]
MGQTHCVRAAAAWGEDVVTSSTVASHLSKYSQFLAVRLGYSVSLAFDNLTYAVQVNKNAKRTDTVAGITGYAEAGKMTAVVGGGRAGKSAFLGTLAGEQDQSKGTIYYNGNEASALVRRRTTGYCWFSDDHVAWHGTTTVREALCLSAYLRQDDGIPDSRKVETVEACLELLGLTEVADQHIDSCSGVETRLVAIGVELAFTPSVLLLDEPTCGLDEKSAQRIIRVMQQIAHTGRTVVCSLGDSAPSTEFRSFDRLLLLSSTGETIFHGESRNLVQYLEGISGVKKINSSKSIIAWALETVGEVSINSHSATTTTTRGSKTRMSTKKKSFTSASSMTGSNTVNHEKETRFVQLFQNSQVRRSLLIQLQRGGYLRPGLKSVPEKETRFVQLFQNSQVRRSLLTQLQRGGYLRPGLKSVPALITSYQSGKVTAYAASWMTQMSLLVRRVVFSYWRSLSSIMTIRSVSTQWQLFGVLGLFMVLFMWFLWIFIAARNTEYDTFDGVNYGVSLIAWSTLVLGSGLTLCATARASRGNAWRENDCWRREQAWKAYPAVTYHTCCLIVELLVVLLITLVAAVFTFTLFDFWSISDSGNFLLYWLTLAIFALGQLYLSQWLVRLVRSGGIAAAAAAGINLLPLLSFVWTLRSTALGNLTWLLVPQRFALQALQALIFGVTADSCISTVEVGGEATGVESELVCRDLRLIPSGERYVNQQIAVHSYAEIEYGAYRDSVSLNLVGLVIILVTFRLLVILSLQKRQTCA